METRADRVDCTAAFSEFVLAVMSSLGPLSHYYQGLGRGFGGLPQSDVEAQKGPVHGPGSVKTRCMGIQISSGTSALLDGRT